MGINSGIKELEFFNSYFHNFTGDHQREVVLQTHKTFGLHIRGHYIGPIDEDFKQKVYWYRRMYNVVEQLFHVDQDHQNGVFNHDITIVEIDNRLWLKTRIVSRKYGLRSKEQGYIFLSRFAFIIAHYCCFGLNYKELPNDMCCIVPTQESMSDQTLINFIKELPEPQMLSYLLNECLQRFTHVWICRCIMSTDCAKEYLYHLRLLVEDTKMN